MRIALLDTPDTDGWSNGRRPFHAVADLLADRGHKVWIIGAVVDTSGSSHPGVKHMTIDRGPLPVLTALNRDVGAGPMIESNLVAHHLAVIKPDLLIASLRGGLAQGVLMARACGEAFEATRVALWCNTPNHLHFLRSDDVDSGIRPVVADALERQSLALADALILPTEEKRAAFTRLAGRALPCFVAALPTIANRPPRPSAVGKSAIDEIVFVGPLRRSAGVDEFVHVIERLARADLLAGRTITFLGPSRPHSAGIGKVWLGLRATAWPFRFRVVDQTDRTMAQRYIARRGRLGVSIADDAADLNFLEQSGHCHIALLRDPGDEDHLTHRLEAILRRALEGRQPAKDTQATPSDWLSLVEAIQALPRPPATRPLPNLGITVCILHHNRMSKLAELLSSIPHDLDGNPVEVIVVDNASNVSGLRDKILAMGGERPFLQIIELAEPVPPSTAHNHGLAQARFETVLFSDDDNIFAPDGVHRLAGAVTQGGFDIVVSALDIFEDGTPPPYPTVGRLVFLGAAHSAGLFFNAFGDTAMAVRRDAFLGLGGFHDPGHLYPCRDWVTLAKAQAAGLRIGALQWPAVRYRRDAARSDLGAHKFDQEGARFFVFEVYGDAYDAGMIARYAQKLYLSEM